MKTLFAHPLITEKSMAASAEGIYQFMVPTWAEKRQIAEFIARTFDVTVENITTSNVSARNVRFKQRAGKQARFKKASVRLKKGQSIAEFSLPVEPTQPTPTTGGSEGEPVTESKITVRSKSKKVATKTEEK